jgi:hypothetical protein
MKIIISSPYYQTIHGGVIVLHKLCHILNEIGFDSYMVNFNGATSPIKLNPNYNTKNINWESIDKENDIIVYPEITMGNPYGFKKCVRYILYHTSQKNIHHTWGNDDFWIYFREGFYDNLKEKNILTIRDTKVDYFQNLGLERTEDSCFTIRKGNRYNHIYKKYHPENSKEIGYMSDGDFLNVFNKHKRFYSYDADTYLSIIAALCGCESVIVPIEGLSKEEWKSKNKDRQYGIAYGLDDIENCKNVDKLKQELVNTEKNQYIEVNDMFDKIVDYFKKNG